MRESHHATQAERCDRIWNPAVTAADRLYRNTRQRLVRSVQWGLWAAALAFALAAAALPWIWPAGDARALAILAPILAGIALGMELYRSLYVTEIRALPGGLLVETLGFRGRRRHLLPWAALHRATAPERRYNARGTDSFAVTLRRPGRRLPFIIDTTRDAFDAAGLAKLARRRARRPD
jgi:hypothetical protein